jgi:NADPH-dependent F420 reductase
MKIGIVGGTGSFGKGLALRWAEKHIIYVGSRSTEKAKEKVGDYRLELRECSTDAGQNLVGSSNREAIVNGDLVVLAVQFEHLPAIFSEGSSDFKDKIVLSPIVSLIREQYFQNVRPTEGSCAVSIQERLPGATVVSALHTIPAHRIQRVSRTLEGDVPVCGDSPEAKEIIINLIKEIRDLNPIDAGPLAVSELVEPMVPLILNVKQFGIKKDTAIRFV